ncbi:hypothetical protein M3Y94_00355900 [Aphelenchoides besseyi]|nr:hypothetical protein M3Y94_00355900 [Aphelenchoides besseyi]KAI6235303.1 Presequence protease, mitochondrial [Aphelenchoides besseyi]
MKRKQFDADNLSYQLVHSDKYLGRVPVHIYQHKLFGLWFCFVEHRTNVTRTTLNYATISTKPGLQHRTAHFLLDAISTSLSQSSSEVNKLDYYVANIYSSSGLNVDVKQGSTSFSFNSLGNSGYTQLICTILEQLAKLNFFDVQQLEKLRRLKSSYCDGEIYLEQLVNNDNPLHTLVTKTRLEHVFSNTPLSIQPSAPCSNDTADGCIAEAFGCFKSFFNAPNAWILASGEINADDDISIFDSIDIPISEDNFGDQPGAMAAVTVDELNNHYSDPIVVYGVSKNQEQGLIQLSFLAGDPRNVSFLNAIDILLEYLNATKVSPLAKNLVYNSKPICSKVITNVNVTPKCEIVIELSGVPVKYLNRFAIERFFQVIRSQKWELTTFNEIIRSKIRKYRHSLNGDFTADVFERLKIFQLYTTSTYDSVYLNRLLNPINVLEELLQVSEVYWQKLANRVFSENCVAIIGCPVKSLLTSEAYLQQVLNEEKLKIRAYNLENNPPESVQSNFFSNLQSVEVAVAPITPQHIVHAYDLKPYYWNLSGSKVQYLPSWFESVKCCIDGNMPFNITLHDTPTDFVKAVFFFDIRHIDLRLRYYLMIFSQLLQSSTTTVDGMLRSQSELIAELNRETLNYHIGMGFQGKYRHLFHLTFEFPASQFELLEKWISANMCDSVFDIENVINIAKSLTLLATENSNDAPSLCAVLMNYMNYKHDYEGYFNNELVLENFHNELHRALQENANFHKQVMDDLNSLREQILNSSIDLHLIGDPRCFKSTHCLNFGGLQRFRSVNKSKKIMVDWDADVRVNCLWNLKHQTHLIPITSISSLGYMIERVNFKVDEYSQQHASLLIFCKYMSIKGGIFWQFISYEGDALHVKLEYCVEEHSLNLFIVGAKDLKKTRDLINVLLKQVISNGVDKVLFMLCKKTVLTELTEPYENLNSAATMSILNNLKGQTTDALTSFLISILKAEERKFQYDVYDAIQLLVNENCQRAAVCSDFDLDECAQSFDNFIHMSSVIKHKGREVFDIGL